MRIGLVGLGRVGLRALRILVERARGVSVVVFERDPGRRVYVESYENVDFVATGSIDEVVGYSRDIDLYMVSLPSREASRAVERLAERCVDIVDVSYTAEDPYRLEKVFRDCGTLYIPDAGFAPGYSNLVAGYMASVLGGLERLEIYVGGIPRENIGPLGYVVTWSAEDLLEEYTRPARVVEDHRVVYRDPLGHVGTVEIPSLGVFEWFYSDGLRTMLRNIRARYMFEATIRWRGHLEKIRLLRDLGLLDRDPVPCDSGWTEPVRLLANVLERRLRIEAEDMAVLYVKSLSRDYREAEELVVVYGSPRDPATTRFTAIVYAETALLVMEKRGELGSGVRPLEELYRYKDYYEERLVEDQPSRDSVYIVKRGL